MPLGVIASLLLGAVWLSPYLKQPSVAGDRYGVVVFGLAAVIELAAEPLWVMAQLQQYVSLKVCSVSLLPPPFPPLLLSPSPPPPPPFLLPLL